MPEPTLNSKIGLYRSGVTSPEQRAELPSHERKQLFNQILLDLERHTSVAREHVLDNSVESFAWLRWKEIETPSSVYRAARNRKDPSARLH